MVGDFIADMVQALQKLRQRFPGGGGVIQPRGAVKIGVVIIRVILLIGENNPQLFQQRTAENIILLGTFHNPRHLIFVKQRLQPRG